jgi:hypothetical protein
MLEFDGRVPLNCYVNCCRARPGQQGTENENLPHATSRTTSLTKRIRGSAPHVAWSTKAIEKSSQWVRAVMIFTSANLADASRQRRLLHGRPRWESDTMRFYSCRRWRATERHPIDDHATTLPKVIGAMRECWSRLAHPTKPRAGGCHAHHILTRTCSASKFDPYSTPVRLTACNYYTVRQDGQDRDVQSTKVQGRPAASMVRHRMSKSRKSEHGAARPEARHAMLAIHPGDPREQTTGSKVQWR